MCSKTFLDGEWGCLVKRHLYWLAQRKTLFIRINMHSSMDLHEEHTEEFVQED
jgi:hypothetical protein